MIYIQLLESMSLIALAAYIYGQITISKRFFAKNKDPFSNELTIILFFTVLSIIGTYTGINVDPKSSNSTMTMINPYAIANTRPIGAIAAGYIGGPAIGFMVGTLAGFQRYSMGGFTALACGISTIVEGLCGGFARQYLKKDHLDPKIGLIAAVIAESLQMIIILVFSKPFNEALELEKIIAIPMILINSFGVVIFINIINDAAEQYNRIGAIQAQKTLIIAEQTLKYLKKGFNNETAENVAKIIYDVNNFKGVFVANNKELLYYCGKKIPLEYLNESLNSYFLNPEYKIVPISNGNMRNELIFFFIPIFNKDKLEAVIGLKLKSKNYVDEYFIQFAKQLSSLLSNQLQIYKLNQIAHEACIAEYKALRTQIHPHFLFNALNTIASFCRINPNKARELIINLSNYFRQTLKREEDFVTIKDECDFLNSYLSIEHARFGDRLKVNINIPGNLLQRKIPVFILQPIVENSIKHGILPRPSGGIVNINVNLVNDELIFTVEDNGIGMDDNKLSNLFLNPSGIGLRNVNERLKLLYGDNYKLKINSSLNEGTCVSFTIPKGDE
ncbi:two-component system LytT family sensor kinase [Clostridium tetanomorphum]|uniref:LytS/YhcK type 5TM receptor domain-containing protein n=1 Tax=Clostridium tetanomorphum TaxID=1553 RepID=UPI00044628B3|nr:LytS/YhcK type 5TM receptor domain-containing protein [Clostridium tetanomorphum]KAJ50563.1 two-component sensor histidine kinase [Clostridium tetanomorphum DSM 665]MBP1862637.1 two-component system LytT family sensor kinase [Clostridium tetanomorphum]NRS85522.1 two-component system LytT family sensor kinase [Clostridium tetanomorphum]